MLVIVNPYHRSVTIDGEEVVQKILEFPNTLNHLSTISCTYDSDEKKITKVHDLHRFTSNFIQREYFFDNLPVFVDWYYAEKQAQIDEEARLQKYKEDVENAINQTVQAGNDAKAAIATDKTNALNAIDSAHTTATNSITGKRAEALNAIQNSKAESLNTITETTNTSVSSVTSAMNTALNNISTERVGAINAISNDKAEALSVIATDRRSSLDEINNSINKATVQADRSKTEADRAKNYADAIESIKEVRPATKEQIGLVIVGDNINVSENGTISVDYTDLVHKSGDETVDGAKTFTSAVTVSNNYPQFFVQDTSVDITVPPAAFRNVRFCAFRDKNNKPMNFLASSFNRDGALDVAIGTINPAVQTQTAAIGVGYNKDGEAYTRAPTPPADDNSTQIATTNWIRQAFPDWLSNNPSTSINADDQAAIHNGIYRGKDLTNVYTLDQLSAKLQAGDFTDLYIGDYITRSFTYGGTTKSFNFRFGHFNYWKYKGSTSLTANHILMVPDTKLFDSKMQETNTTEGGVHASIVHQLLQGDVYTAMNAANCMGGHVLPHTEYHSSILNKTGASRAGADHVGTMTYDSAGWQEQKLGMFNEQMVCGNHPWGSSGEDARKVGCTQIALFRLDPSWINGRSGRYYWWLGVVTNLTAFAFISHSGLPSHNGASIALGVRPFFLFS